MNTQLITDRTTDLVSLLNIANSEAKEIESKREALRLSEQVNTAREQRLNDKEIDLKKVAADLDSQKQYIDEQSKNAQIILSKITTEKEELKDMATQKLEIEKERLQLEADKKGFESMKLERDKFEIDRKAFEEERQLFAKEKLAMSESQKLFTLRENNFKVKEEALNRRLRLSEV